MPLISEDGVPVQLRAGDEIAAPPQIPVYKRAAANATRVAVFAFCTLALLFAFRMVWGLAIISALFAIAFGIAAWAVEKNKNWARALGLSLFAFIGCSLILSAILTARPLMAMNEQTPIATFLSLILVATGGAALCWYPRKWFVRVPPTDQT